MIFSFANFNVSYVWDFRLLLSSSCPSVRPHVTTHVALDGFWRNFLFEPFLRKSAQKIQVSLKFDKKTNNFTPRRFHIYENISLNYF
jgi:hypothetical protein